MTRATSLFVSAGLFSLLGAAAAQEQAPVPAEEPQRRVIQEVIVTAQKTEQDIHDVPISMSVLDDQFLHDEGITDFRDVTLYVPNAVIDNSATFPDVRIRGFGSPLSNKAFEQSVGLVIDGVAYGRAAYWQGPIFDLERVEVLRGPQGTLFGKNTTAGLFNVVTKRPTDELTGSIRAELGELDHRRFEGGIGGPIVKGFLNFRISGLSDERDGLVENTTAAVVAEALDRMNGRDRKAVRLQLGLPNLLGARLNLSYEKVDSDLIGTGWEFSRVTPRELAFFRQYDPNTDVDPDNWVGSVDHDELGTRKLDTFVANASYDIGRWGLDGVVGYSVLDLANHNDVDFTPAPMFWTDSVDTNPQTSFELRLHSPSLRGFLGLGQLFGYGLGTSEFTSGFFYQRRTLGDSALAISLNAPVIGQFVLAQGIPTSLATGAVPNMPIIPTGVPFPINADTIQVLLGPDAGIEQSTGFFDQTANAVAGFGQMSWHFVEHWTLEPGMRFTWESKKADISRVFTKGTGIAFNAVAGQEEFSTHKDRSETAFTPQVTLRYDWTDDINTFAKWARGYKAGGFNELASIGTEGLEFKAEKIAAYEVGSKMRLLGGAASLNVGLFWNDVTDMQVFTLRPNDLVATVENAGKARARGVEIDGAYLPTSWLTVVGGLGFLEAKYLDFPFGECPMDMENTDGDDDPRCDLSGSPLYQAPKWTVSLTPTARFATASLPGVSAVPLLSAKGMDVVFGGSGEYEDVHFTTRSDDPRTRQPSFFRFNLNFGFENVTQGWSARVMVKNLTEEAVAMQSRDITLGQGTFVHILEEPRLIIGSFQYRF